MGPIWTNNIPRVRRLFTPESLCTTCLGSVQLLVGSSQVILSQFIAHGRTSLRRRFFIYVVREVGFLPLKRLLPSLDKPR